jgi:hypothetical protein
MSFTAIFVDSDHDLIRDTLSSSDEEDDYETYVGWSWRGVPQNRIRQLVRVEIAMLAFVTLLLALHFALFVRACIETAQRNAAKTPPIVIYVPVPMAMANATAAGYTIPTEYYAPTQEQLKAGAPAQSSQTPQVYEYYAPMAQTQPILPMNQHTPREVGP